MFCQKLLFSRRQSEEKKKLFHESSFRNNEKDNFLKLQTCNFKLFSLTAICLNHVDMNIISALDYRLFIQFAHETVGTFLQCISSPTSQVPHPKSYIHCYFFIASASNVIFNSSAVTGISSPKERRTVGCISPMNAILCPLTFMLAARPGMKLLCSNSSKSGSTPAPSSMNSIVLFNSVKSTFECDTAIAILSYSLTSSPDCTATIPCSNTFCGNETCLFLDKNSNRSEERRV